MQDLVERLSYLLERKQLKLTTAESCTGGLLSSGITARAGASYVFERGFITYSNQAKHEMLGVPEELLETYGAVSAEVAESMAQGALNHSAAGLAISITGIAGPDGGSDEKPVGLVYFCYDFDHGEAKVVEEHFSGSRTEIQLAAARKALELLIDALEDV
ncbi:MAG: CinA family protein [Alphaproteobacteria bacterium]|nr:CinA family protein [Alphaproteobacteria bacterium]